MIHLVSAVSRNGVIGRENGLPWYLPADLQHFRELTLGKTVLMGRSTFESIVDSMHQPLPDRRNVVITRDQNFSYPGVDVVHSVDSALRCDDDLFVIGGAVLFREMIDIADKMHLTEIQADIVGDTYFPQYESNEWRELKRDHHPADEQNQYSFDFVEYERSQ